MDTPRYPHGRRAADLAAAAWLELGLEALQRGEIPAAVSALVCIDDASWDAILRRFPHLPTLIERWSNPR